MKNILDLFADKNIRVVWDEKSSKWWFSGVDICAALMDCDHQRARKYLAWLKGKMRREKIESASVTRRLNFPAANGTGCFTDAMDFESVLRLIMACPSPKAVPIRLWFAGMLAENPLIAEQFNKIGTASQNKLVTEDALLRTVRSEVIE
ncbi:MAG: hypothetical protein FWF77_05460 [Defluviitaleaceae bacterium]|nr:hypothetical protein [Defluviitaleaceae bacterium]